MKENDLFSVDFYSLLSIELWTVNGYLIVEFISLTDK